MTCVKAQIHAMRVMSANHLRKNLAATLDGLASGPGPVLITRAGQPAAVLMSLDDYASDEETNHLLRSPENRRYLLEAIAELDAGRGIIRELLE